MPDGQPEKHVLRFIAIAISVSLVLGVSLLVVSWLTSSAFVLGLMSTLVVGVPAWSAITAAVGAPARRKLTYSVGLLAFLLAFDLFAAFTGWQALATEATVVNGAAAGVLVAAYRLVLVSSPFVTVVLFVGSRPSLLWTTSAR